MNFLLIIIQFIWFSAIILTVPNIIPYAKDLEFFKQIIVIIVIILGAPFMLITQAIELILDAFLAEGWDNDDDDKY